MSAQPLRIERGGARRDPPPDRGDFLSPEQIQEKFFAPVVIDDEGKRHGRRSTEWIRRNFAPEHKKPLGHSTVGWWEYDAIDWISQSGNAA